MKSFEKEQRYGLQTKYTKWLRLGRGYLGIAKRDPARQRKRGDALGAGDDTSF
jgi:hypothetical protein